MKLKTVPFKPIAPLFAAALMAALVCGCGGGKSNAAAEQAATAAAQSWLADVDNGQYAQSWQDASPFFQGAVPEQKWESALTAVRKPLGDLGSRNLKSAQYATRLPDAPVGQYVVMQFDTSFANKKSAIETVTFSLESDGKWRASGYYIK
jgi:hypothetical protein